MCASRNARGKDPVYCKLNCGFNDEDTRLSLASKSHIFIYFIFNRISDPYHKAIFILCQRDLEPVKYFCLLHWSVKYSTNFRNSFY